MNRLDNKERANILKMICEGMGINAACRVTGASKNTVLKLLTDVGNASAEYLDKNIIGLNSKRVECDEVWSFCYAKQKNVATAKDAPEGAGDVWTWTALDADTKLIVSYLVGGRDAEYALAFMDDLHSRIVTRAQLTTDGHKAYLLAVEEAFGGDVDYAQLVKMFGNTPENMKGKYSPAECTGIKKTVISGDPDMKNVSTSYVERSNLTMRMHNRRFTRLTNGFSKKLKNHLHAISLFVINYNYCKIHKSLRITPAMAAGLTDHVWELEEVISLLAEDEQPKKRGTYKKKISN
jgi:IS1 family transposase